MKNWKKQLKKNIYRKKMKKIINMDWKLIIQEMIPTDKIINLQTIEILKW